LNRNHSQTARDLIVFTLLVAIGVAGRWGQPAWEFTPIAAATIFAGCYFSRLSLAALVPVAILAISDLGLSAYNSAGVMLVKYASMAAPVFFGRLLRNNSHGGKLAWRWGLCGLAPATLFFITTNFAVWVFQSDYPKTLAGLAQCYAAGVLFFRSMLAGDLFYLAVLFSCWALAGESAPRGRLATE
jgi:hypothetical protein